MVNAKESQPYWLEEFELSVLMRKSMPLTQDQLENEIEIRGLCSLLIVVLSLRLFPVRVHSIFSFAVLQCGVARLVDKIGIILHGFVHDKNEI